MWDDVAREREAGDEPPLKQRESEPAPAETVAVEATPEKVEPAAAAPAAPEDPFAGMSPALKQRFEQVEALARQAEQVPALLQNIKTAEGRVAAMQREMDVAKAAAKAAPAGPSTAQIAAASGDVKKWDNLKSDFPEWAEATEQYVNAKLAGITPAQAQNLDPKEVEAWVQAQGAKAQAAALAAVEEAKVEIKHPDWAEKVVSPEFKTWFEKQGDDVKALSQSVRGRDAVRMLDLFNEHQTKANTTAEAVQQTRSKKLAAAVTTRPGAPVAPATKSVEDMSAAELWEYERKRNAKRGSERGLTY